MTKINLKQPPPTDKQINAIYRFTGISPSIIKDVIQGRYEASEIIDECFKTGRYENASKELKKKIKNLEYTELNDLINSAKNNLNIDFEKLKILSFQEKLNLIPKCVDYFIYSEKNKKTLEHFGNNYEPVNSEEEYKSLRIWNSQKQIELFVIGILEFSVEQSQRQFPTDMTKNNDVTIVYRKIDERVRELGNDGHIIHSNELQDVWRLTHSELIESSEPRYGESSEINISTERKRKSLPQTILLALIKEGKTIDDIKSNSNDYPGALDQEIHRYKPIWHNKKEIDQYVREKLKISEEEWNIGDSNRQSFWYNYVAAEISKLRDEGIITDWNPDKRTGIWRLTDLKGIKETELRVETENNIIKDDELLSKLPILSESDINKGYEEISKELLIKKETINEILNALMSKRHVLLTGPIGTGKTHLAKRIPEIFWKKYGGYKAEEYTATSDWSVQDVIGGVFPTMNGENIAYSFLNGCILETLEKDWEIKQRRRIENVDTPRGVWATIDEFNRADIDKAFGQLFTALRTGEIKYFKNNQDKTYERKIIPDDFRIIGTMNTSDKTFLYNLSDALKSRFAFIEIDVPEYQLKEEEMGMALSNALKELDIEAKELGIELFKNESLIDSKLSNENIIRILQYATEVLFIVRCFKKLGTSILKTIFQSLLISLNTMESKENEQGKLFEYHSESLDTAIISTIVPQLENLESKSDLNILKAILDNELISFIRKSQKDIERENNLKSIKKILKFMKLDSEIEQKFVTDYESGNSIEDSLSKIQQEWSEKNILKAFKLKQTSKALSNLEESMIL